MRLFKAWGMAGTLTLAVVLGLGVGCKEKTTAEKIQDSTEKAVDSTKDAAKKTGEAIKDGTQKAGEEIKDAAKKVENAVTK